MNELFGLSMTYIAIACVALTSLIFLLVAYIAWRNPVMFKLGLRNIPRRKAQTALIIVGLMLSTLIMSAAFGTGDTLTSSVTSEVYSILGEADEWVSWDTEKAPAPESEQVIPLSEVEEWQRMFADDPDIEAIVPFQRETLPIQNLRTRLNDPSARIVAFREQDAAALGGLKDVRGDAVVLTANDIAINEDLAEEIEAQIGDSVILLYQGAPVEFVVRALVPPSVLSGAIDPNASNGAAVNFDALSSLTGRGQNADAVFISNTGGVKEGLEYSDAVMAKFEPLLEDTSYQIVALKKDLVEFAELIGAAFTTLFVVFGLFSIAAGVLLIFLIFVMLAAERKPEMGMARAVGAKRRQLVESFLAEGMGYDLGAAFVGLFAGMGVTIAMVAVIKAFAGDALGLDLTVTFTVRSMIIAFCLGVIATFLVIFISSWRASRLNITSAIRDLPESKPIDPESSTWRGYFRGVINGIVALSLVIGLSFLFFGSVGMILGLPLIVIGLISPWFYALRGSDFAAPRDHRTGEGAPKWPWILGVVVPGIGWFLILPFYALALLLVRLTRDRKPESLPRWAAILAMVVWPLALLVALLQNWKVRIAWSAGVATAFGIAGVAMTYGGLDRNSAFFALLGLSLIGLWVAITLRYFGVAERLAFTAVSLATLVIWYLPSRVTEPVVGELNGDIEMFFLSGLVMVTCGVFIIVYNADIVLPAIGALFSRFSRIVPAIKTGVAYPLTSRFRTGMTMLMIGLIMFSLVMMSTINSNFAQLFLNEDSKGGFDNVLAVNPNNPIDDLEATLAASGVDTSPITGVGELRIAYTSETEIENRDGFENSDGEVAAYSRAKVAGASPGFLTATSLTLKGRAIGYNTDREVWDALLENPNFAVIPAATTAEPDAFGPPAGDLIRLNPLGAVFEPFTLELRDPATGTTATITVIGQLKEAGDTFLGLGTPDFQASIITGQQVVAETLPASRGQFFYVTLAEGTDAEEYAKAMEAGLLAASAESLQALLDEQQRISTGFLLVFQGFMGLGLIVGIAALAVIASRAVVERRQQIGMLRAIGYQRGMVALSFLFESGFIAVSGILLGLSLGLSFAWVLFTSGEFGEDVSDINFTVPWLQLGIICGIAFVASMVMTYLPARSASKVPVAEALRYE